MYYCSHPLQSEYGYPVQEMYSKFLSKNIPVVVGETSATNRNNTSERVKWADYYWGTAAKYSNVAMVLWDNNIYQNNASGSDGECHMYIDRNSLQWKDPEIISTIMKHVDGTPATINGKEIPGTKRFHHPLQQRKPLHRVNPPHLLRGLLQAPQSRARA